MTPTQARAFLAVAIEGSFTGAAKRLNLSQPSVTTQVGLLERQYSDCSNGSIRTARTAV
jgi:LysR family transcriptional regulator, low CO2-responsive transcriptional regulator